MYDHNNLSITGYTMLLGNYTGNRCLMCRRWKVEGYFKSAFSDNYICILCYKVSTPRYTQRLLFNV